MADQIVYEVILDTAGLTRQAAETRKQIEDLRAAQKNLDTSTEAGRVAYEQNATALRGLQTQLRQTTKDIDNTNKVLKSETGSIAANRAELARLTAEYIKSGNPTKEQTKNIRNLSDTLKQQERAIGDTRRNVGNYTSAITGLGSALPGAGAAMEAFNVIASANPIGVVVASITGLIALLKDYEPAADGFAVATSSMSASLDVLRQRAGTAGQAIISFLSGNVVQSVALLSSSFSGLSAELNEAPKAGAIYAKGVEEIADANVRLSISNAEAERSIAVLRKQLRDRTKDDTERLAIADQITAIEQKRFDQEKRILEATAVNERFALVSALRRAGISEQELEVARNRGNANQNLIDLAIKNNAAEKERNRLAEAAVALLNKQAESESLLEKITVDRNRIEAEAEQRRQAALQRRLQLAEQLRRQEERNRELAIKARQEEIATQEKNTNDFFDRQKIEIQNRFAERLISQEQFENELAANERDRRARQLQDLQDYGESTVKLEEQIAQERVEVRKAFDEQVEELLAQEVAAYDKAEQDKKTIRDAQLAAEQQLATSVTGLINSIGQATKQGAEAAKAVALFQIGLDSGKAIANIVELATAPTPDNLLSGGTLVPIKIATLSATVLANIARAVATINSSGFYEGGYTGDGDPRQESTALGRKPYVYHKQEYVVDHKTLSIPMVSDFIERYVEPVRRGNRPMGLSGMADGGFVVSQVNQAVQTGLQSEKIARAIARMQPVVRVSEINSVNNRVKVLADNNSM